MLCQRCEKNQATTHYQENVNGNVREMHLCAACAAEMTSAIPGFGWSFGQVPAFFAQSAGGAGQAIGGGRRCDTCGMTESELRRTGRAGCAACYQNFGDILLPYIKKLHGAAAHVGTAPAPLAGQSAPSPLEGLKARLTEAVQAENYEEAARLRDEIRRLEGEDT